MIRLQPGTNQMVIPKQDLPDPLPDAVMLQLANKVTGRIVWCRLEDSANYVDWRDFTITLVTYDADPQQGEIAMTQADAGEWLATLYGGSSYSESPMSLTKLREERCAYSVSQ